MAVDRGVLTLGGKGSSLSQTSVFEFANASPPQILKIDPSALVELPSSLSGHKLQSLSSPFKLQLSVPDDLTPEEARASILLLLNTLLLCGSASPSVASQLSDILNNDAQTFTLDLEFDRQDDVDFVKDCWPDIISVAICALLDYAASSLSKVADAVAALSCEVLKTDTTTAFNFFRDSGDGFSDKDSDLNVFLNGSKMCGNTQCDLVSDIRGTHGRLRSVCKLIHSSTRVKLNSIPPVHGGASKDLTRLFSFLASALHDLGEDSWERAKLFLDKRRQWKPCNGVNTGRMDCLYIPREVAQALGMLLTRKLYEKAGTFEEAEGQHPNLVAFAANLNQHTHHIRCIYWNG